MASHASVFRCFHSLATAPMLASESDAAMTMAASAG